MSEHRGAGWFVALLGAAMAGVSILADVRNGGQGGFGFDQAVLLNVGVAVALLGLDLRAGKGADWRAAMAANARDAGRILWIALQLALVVYVAEQFQIENPALARQVIPLVAAGFVLHHLVPLARRLMVFVSLSLTSFVMVLGWANAGWIVAITLLLIAICHVPIAWRGRLAVLLGAAAGLGVLRVHAEWSPFSRAIWPVLGSMLMFRLIVYWYDVRHAKAPTPLAWSLAYFFMVPNVVFPLFPVVDFATMRRMYYDQDAFAIYHRGLDWILRGLIHLLVYRFVYQHATLAPTDVTSGALLIQYMVSTFFLYLRVSGTFHLIVGMLCLFGFRLPETHRFFYVASSFTDFWRRINIYWKDFMMKTVFYPVYFPLRKKGETSALVVGTLAVFLVTWLTHAYQWFWILGTSLVSWTDGLFWAALGVLLVVNSLWEAKHGRRRVLPGETRRRWQEALVMGLKAAGVFAVICTLWSMWGTPTLGDWFDLLSVPRFTARDYLAVFGTLGAVAAIGFISELSGRAAGDMDKGKSTPRPTFTKSLSTGFVLGALALSAVPSVLTPFGVGVQEIAREMRFPELNKRDAAALRRGYYENLQGVSLQNSQLWELYAQRPTEGQDIWKSGVLKERPDFLAREMRPLFGAFQNGRSFRTNRWGMRDHDYAQEKPAGVFRIALLGQSYVAGDGVNDDETFDELTEARLDSARPADRPKVEILNFAVGSFSVAQELMLLQDRVFAFKPDVVVLVEHPEDADRVAIHMVQQIRRGVHPPWPFADSILTRAGITQDTRETEALSRMKPVQDELLVLLEKEIVRQCLAQGIRPVWVLLDIPERAPDPKRVMVTTAQAREAGFTDLFDWSDVYAGHDLRTLQVSSSDFHPNADGHRLIADRFYRDLTSATGISSWLAGRPHKEIP